ncbi:MAG: DUF5937 family protein [bacterium]
MISLRFPERSEELVSFEVSALLEAVHSWHVLLDPGHHALHLPWVRACREMPAAVRRDLRRLGFVVADYVPAFFEVAAEHPDITFEEQLDRLLEVPADQLADELSRTLIDTARWSGHEMVWDSSARRSALEELERQDPERAALLGRALAEPETIVMEVRAALLAYWRAGFDREWARIEPVLHDGVARAGWRIAAEGTLSILRDLVPQIQLDGRERTLRLNRPHEHVLDVAEAGGVRFTPSHYAWPHVRVTCDAPWPVRITYPVAPLSVPASDLGSDEQLLARLRALGSVARLQIVQLVRQEPRSTQELAGLLSLSTATISRHLRQLLDAGVVTTRREGYYVLYVLDPAAMADTAHALNALAGNPPAGRAGVDPAS